MLYDCPILIGNQEYFQFDVKGVPHFVAIENVAADVDRAKMVADLKTMVTAATQLMGDVPYKHYTFLMMGRGGGGIEHSNSSSNQFDGTSLSTPAGYLRWLSFICHEYFHNFNVKRIRPLALGPFDYDQENLTNMLWVSEGLSVYYQDLVLVRAGPDDQGAVPRQDGGRHRDVRERFRPSLSVGHGIQPEYLELGIGSGRRPQHHHLLLQQRRDAGRDARSEDPRGQRQSQVARRCDARDCTRSITWQKKRGFTDAEFRAECESAAGTSLADIFEYASTTKEVDYARYFALAGLKLEADTADAPGGYIGLDTRHQAIPPSEMPPAAGRGGRGGRGAGGGRGRGNTVAFRLMVTDVAAGSPAAMAGLKAGDRIVDVDGAAATAPVLNDAINGKKPGEKIKLHVSRAGAELDLAVEVARNVKRTYRLSIEDGATATQSKILNDWLRKAL